MHAEDRLIHFSSELVHKPVRKDTAEYKRLYFELSQRPDASYDNTDFSNPAQPKIFTRRGQKTYSGLVLLPDRLVVLEEWADTTLLSFMDRAAAVAGCYQEVLETGPYAAQVVTLRAACSISNGDSAKDFVLYRLCSQQRDAMLETLGRPCDVGSVRLLFNETAEHPGTFHIAIEPFRFGPREVLVEVKAIFRNQVIDGDGLSLIQDNIRNTRSFLSQRVYPYLNQFDTPGVT